MYPQAEWRYDHVDYPLSDNEYLFDEERANNVIDFIESACVLSTGRRAGKKIQLLDWQKHDVIEKLFGTVRWSDLDERWVRQYNDCDIWIPRKNGKSTLIASIGLYLTGFEEHLNGRAQVIAVASTMKQAQIIFKQAKFFILKDKYLKKAFKIRNFPHGEIEHISSGGIFKVIAADGDNSLGEEPTAVLFDEIAIQKNSGLIDALAGGQGSLPEPLFISISTAGYKNTHKFGYELYNRSLEVYSKPWVEPNRLVCMYPLADDADWEDEENWKYANPSLGTATSLDFLRKEYNKTKTQPWRIPHFKAYYLNIWSDSESLWIDEQSWAESGMAGGPVVKETLEGRECYGGLDLASVDDLASWALFFPGSPTDETEEGYTVLVKTWGTQEALNRMGRDEWLKARLRQWDDEGWIDLSAEQRISQTAIKEQMRADAKKYKIRYVGYDKWNSAGIEEDLAKELTMIDVPQSTQILDSARREFQMLVKEKHLYHGSNPVLAWNVSNVVVTTDNVDRIVMYKGKAKEKIDGVAATINAIHVSQAREEEEVFTGFIPLGPRRR